MVCLPCLLCLPLALFLFSPLLNLKGAASKKHETHLSDYFGSSELRALVFCSNRFCLRRTLLPLWKQGISPQGPGVKNKFDELSTNRKN